MGLRFHRDTGNQTGPEENHEENGIMIVGGNPQKFLPGDRSRTTILPKRKRPGTYNGGTVLPVSGMEHLS